MYYIFQYKHDLFFEMVYYIVKLRRNDHRKFYQGCPCDLTMTPFINLLCTRYGVIIRILFFASFTYVTFYMCVCANIIVMYACIYNWILFLYFQLKNIFFSCHDINVNTLIFALLSFTIAAVETSIHLLWYIVHSL